jgi:hypothetical protein
MFKLFVFNIFLKHVKMSSMFREVTQNNNNNKWLSGFRLLPFLIIHQNQAEINHILRSKGPKKTSAYPGQQQDVLDLLAGRLERAGHEQSRGQRLPAHPERVRGGKRVRGYTDERVGRHTPGLRVSRPAPSAQHCDDSRMSR